MGKGCVTCGLDKLKGAYNETFFVKFPDLKTKNSILYVVYFEHKDTKESFYKIGITTTDPRDRGKSLKSKSKGFIKNYDIIYTEEMSLYDAFLKEEYILNKFSENRTYTKCFRKKFT